MGGQWRRCLALVCCLLSACGGADPVPAGRWRASIVRAGQVIQAQHDVAMAVAPEVLTVRAEACGLRTTGSGFLIDGLIVTNAHVVDGARSIQVSGPALSGEVQVGRVAAGPDLALAPVGLPSGLTWADVDPATGDPVVLVGRGRGAHEWLPARVHLYDSVGPFGLESVAMLLDRPTTPGYSGGPVVDLDGRVVGVLRAVDLSTDLSLAEPVSAFQAWLTRDKYEDSSTSCIP